MKLKKEDDEIEERFASSSSLDILDNDHLSTAVVPNEKNTGSSIRDVKKRRILVEIDSSEQIQI